MLRAATGWRLRPAGKQLSAQATSCHTSGGWPTAMISAVLSDKMYDQQQMMLPWVNVGTTATLHKSPPSRPTLLTGGFQQHHHCRSTSHK
jgi:hypothetical protein